MQELKTKLCLILEIAAMVMSMGAAKGKKTFIVSSGVVSCFGRSKVVQFKC